MSSLTSEAKKRAKLAQEEGPSNPIRALSKAGFRSEWAFIGGFASIIFSFIVWGISQGKDPKDKPQSDRWGIFVGHWAPTFFGLGIALKLEEDS